MGIDYFYLGGKSFDLRHACIGCCWYSPFLWKNKFLEEGNKWLNEKMGEDKEVIDFYSELHKIHDVLSEEMESGDSSYASLF